MVKSEYRPDIDGLRAIAVLVVIFYHLGFDAFSGGFVGVDIFFVISGFLITRLIVNEVRETGSFQFSRFYVRRMRRLFPALFATLLFSTVFACLLFSPSSLKQFGESLFYSVFSISNFLFWQESGYFDSASDLKPLLHTWSLSVEEQFYLVWPLALILLLKAKNRGLVPAALIVACLVSLYLNHIALDASPETATAFQRKIDQWVPSGPAAAFFLLPFRVFEFAIGGLMVWLVAYQPRNKAILEALLAFGIGLISYAVFSFDANTPFPSFNALIPCMGTALAIYAGRARFLGKCLSNPVSVSIGTISYSLYLVHWPLIVFLTYWKFEALSQADIAYLLVATLILGFIMYRYVETPFRKSVSARIWRGKIVMVTACSLAISIAIPAYSMVSSDGWKWRIDEDRKKLGLGGSEYHKAAYGGVGIPANKIIEIGDPQADPSFMFAGDSYALQYANALDGLLKQNNAGALGLFDHGCFIFPDSTRYLQGKEDKSCSAEYDKLAKALEDRPRMDVFLSYSWDGYKNILGVKGGSTLLEFKNYSAYRMHIANQLDKLVSSNGKQRDYFIIGVQERYGSKGSLVDCLYRPSIIPTDCNVYAPVSNPEINDFLRQFSEQHENVAYIEPREAFCANGLCSNLVNGKPVHSDGAHLSKSGAEAFVSHFARLFVGQREFAGSASVGAPQ